MTEQLQGEMGTPIGDMNSWELKKVGKGALIAMAGALLAYLAQQTSGANWGEYSFLAAAIGAILTNFARLLLTDNTNQM